MENEGITIIKMNTERMTELKERFEKSKKSWVAKVINTAKEGNKSFSVVSIFDSCDCKIENILHKVELDLFTNLENGFTAPISILIEEKNK